MQWCSAIATSWLTHPAGKQATANVKESLEWGTKIVGGVKPGVEGEHLGLPIFPSVKAVRGIPILDMQQ